MPRKNPETKFKEAVQEDLKTIPCWFSKIQQVAIRGIPDIILCVAGHFVALELKIDSPVTELQKYNIRKIKQSGGTAYVVTPNNWKKIFQQLKRMAHGKNRANVQDVE